MSTIWRHCLFGRIQFWRRNQIRKSSSLFFLEKTVIGKAHADRSLVAPGMRDAGRPIMGAAWKERKDQKGWLRGEGADLTPHPWHPGQRLHWRVSHAMFLPPKFVQSHRARLLPACPTAKPSPFLATPPCLSVCGECKWDTSFPCPAPEKAISSWLLFSETSFSLTDLSYHVILCRDWAICVIA